MSRRVRFLLLPLLLLAVAPTTPGHDLAFTEVLVVVKTDGAVIADVVADLDALALGASPRTDSAELAAALAALSPEALAARVEGLERLFQRRVRLRADGEPIPFRVRFPERGAAPSGDTGADAEPTFLGLLARLEGRLPPGTATITFQTSRAFPPVRLAILEEETLAGRRTLVEQGGESEPYALGQAEPATAGRAEVAGQYLVLGFWHIIPAGLDHILFVLGLFLLAPRVKPLLWQVSAFTLAHTLTLALSSYGVIDLPPRIVEPLIALSIAYVGIENAATGRLAPWRPLLVFAFGLLHGLGFAGVLGELGLPRDELLTALVAFNVGVELGQLAVLALAFLALGWARDRPWYRPRVAIPLSLVIAALGLFWFVERLLA